MGFNVVQKVRNLKESPVRLGRINFADFSLGVLNSEHLSPVMCAPGECYRTGGGWGVVEDRKPGLNILTPVTPNQYFPTSPSLGAKSFLYPEQHAITITNG